MSPSIKVCPFCMVDARTDASCCAYCGSLYERIGSSAAPGILATRSRRRTYDGSAHCTVDTEALCLSLD